MNSLCKVLVVDDELIMRQGISHMIDWEDEGFKLIGQASNGEEALEIIKEDVPNILITDVVMPKIDGVKLIKLLQNSYPDIKIIVLSSYSDFDYVKASFKYGAIDYILKPTLSIDELLKTLKRAASSIEGIELDTKSSTLCHDESLYKLITEEYDNIESSLFQNTFKYDAFSLFGIDVKGLGLDFKTVTHFNNDIRYYLENFISNEIIVKEIKYKDNILLYLINSSTKNLLTLNKSAKNISTTLNEKYKNSSFILSNSCIALKNLKSIFENSFLKLLDISFYYKEDCFINDSFILKNIALEKFDFNKFYEYTAKMEMESSLSMLKVYIEKALESKSLNKFDLKSLIQNCFYNIISTLDNNGNNAEKLKSLKFKSFSIIENSLYSEDLLNNFKSLYTEFEEIIKGNHLNINSHMIDKITSYINKHYSEQLTLRDVSKIFNFNYYYLSSYFGSHNKEGFNEFINKIRIEKACDFLKQDIPISNVCGMVGYTDHSYFTKVFKKFTGMTPSAYRKNSIKLT